MTRKRTGVLLQFVAAVSESDPLYLISKGAVTLPHRETGYRLNGLILNLAVDVSRRDDLRLATFGFGHG